MQALSFSDQGKVSGEVVFAGYGIKVPEGKDLSYDSFFGLDLQGKVALVLRYFPEETRPGATVCAVALLGAALQGDACARGRRRRSAGRDRTALAQRRRAGADDVRHRDRRLWHRRGVDRVATWRSSSSPRRGATSPTHRRRSTPGTPTCLGFPLAGARVTLDVAIERERREGHNVVGVLPARADRPAPRARGC